MKTKILLFISLVLLCVSCQKEEVKLGSIVGVVSDKASGQFLPNVLIQLVKTGETKVTGDDGRFSFINLKAGTYTLVVSKSGYKPQTELQVIVNSNDIPVFIQLEKLPSSFQIIDENGDDLKELIFGYQDVTRSFSIRNNGFDKLIWSVDENKSNYVAKVSPSSGEIKSGKSAPVMVVIDRTKLNEGTNESSLFVKSQDNVSKEIKIKVLNYKSPKIVLYEAEKVNYDSATLVGSVLDPGIPEYSVFGFVLSSKNIPDLTNSEQKFSFQKKDVEKLNRISHTFTGLKDDTTYFARAYAISQIDTTYSSHIAFVTREVRRPQLKITKTGENGLQVSFKSEIIDNGGSPITEKGVCWSTEQMPEVGQNSQRTKDGTGDGAFTSTISGLLPNTTYYFRSYAKNADGYDYGYSDNQEIVLTTSGEPKLDIINVTQTSYNSVDVQYKVTDDAGSTIKEHGVCYANKQNPTINDTKIKNDNGGVNGECIIHIDGLQGNKEYYFRAYAINSADVPGYSNQMPYKIDLDKPTVITGNATAVTKKTAICSGSVTGDGGSPIIERGICWSATNPKPTLDNSNIVKAETSGIGSFTCALTGLNRATKYYYTAYALNNSGIPGYGEPLPFTTLADVPTVFTYDASVANGSIVLKGKIIDNGGYEITRCGFICNNGYNYEAPLSSGEFSRTIKTSELAPGTTYSFYAYAYNGSVNEPGKGETKNFTTPDGKPKVTNRGASVNSATSATIVGNITDDGGFTITECGVCYSKDISRPTKENSEYTTITNVKSGQFSSTITGLEPNTKYYYNVYALNGNGITYGIPDNFKTQNVTLTVKISQQPTYNGNSATIYGQISALGAEIVEYGVVYSISTQSPTIDNHLAKDNRYGSPSSSDVTFTVTGFQGQGMIYYRIYAISEFGNVAYSSSGYIIGL
ncbi:MAG: carboxypeptidase-like regulatory domain-containing protein [Paludibacteraceae bacterium]|nr:carboxypeptidase-like regulatory domain-containing protein [Paludibacteraceae bacterium]